jgi:hypothetical protein
MTADADAAWSLAVAPPAVDSRQGNTEERREVRRTEQGAMSGGTRA